MIVPGASCFVQAYQRHRRKDHGTEAGRFCVLKAARCGRAPQEQLLELDVEPQRLIYPVCPVTGLSLAPETSIMSCFLRNRGTVARDTCDCMGLDVNRYRATERKTDHGGKDVAGNTPD